MEDVLTRAQARPRFLTLLLSLFSIVAFAIATVGIYGVVSYSVARRTKEFGLRMVLGAQGGDVLGLVMKQGAGMVAIGIVAGLATAFALTRLMASLLFGVTPTDLPTFAAVTVVLFAVALAACYVPARRATCVDPIQTLRYECWVMALSTTKQIMKIGATYSLNIKGLRLFLRNCCSFERQKISQKRWRRWSNLACHLPALQFSLARHAPTRPAPDARSLGRANSDSSVVLRLAGLRRPRLRCHAHRFRVFVSGDAAFCGARRG